MSRQDSTHIDSAAAVGERLRRARKEAGMRQADLSFPGCTIGYISRIESGDRVPSLQVIRRLAERLGVSESWLAQGADGPMPAAAALLDASVALRLDDLEAAEQIYGEIAQTSPERRARAEALAGLGQIAYRRGALEAAIGRFERAFALTDDFDEAAVAADTLGRAHARSGDGEAAVGLFRLWLDRSREAGDPVESLRFSVLLANALIDSAQFREAAKILADVVAETSGGDPMQLARIYWSQSRLHAMRGEPAVATRYARKAYELLEASEHTYLRAKAHQTLAFAELDAGRAVEALDLLSRGRELLGESGTPQDVAEFQLEEARALTRIGRIDEAAALAMATASLLRDGHPLDAGRCYGEIALAFDRAGDAERAEELYELAIEFLDQGPNRFLAETYLRYGELLERRGKKDAAFTVYKRGMSVRAELEQLARSL
jgi:tetratricopeptide (TPR) repeat protein